MSWLSGWAVGLGADVLVLLGLVAAARSLPKARESLRQEISAEVGRQIGPLVDEIRALVQAVDACTGAEPPPKVPTVRVVTDEPQAGRRN